MKRIMIWMLAAAFACGCGRTDGIDDYSGADLDPFIRVAQESYYVDNTSTYAHVAVESNVWWQVDVDYPDGTRPWVEGVTPSATNATREIEFVFAGNLAGTDREATVTIRPKVASAVEPCVFTLVQGPSAPFIDVVCDNFSDEALLLGVVKDECLLEIRSNYDWTIDNTEAPWLTFNPSSGKGDVEEISDVVCSFPSNDSGDVRTGFVVVTAGDAVRRIEVFQDKDFARSELTVINGEELVAEWTPVVGVTSYTLEIRNENDGGNVGDITLEPTTVSFDLAAWFAENNCTERVSISLRATSADPVISSVSEAVATHPLFADASGSGSSADDAYCISSLRHLSNIARSGLVTGYYRQTADLDLEGTVHTPIGSAALSTWFGGTYDGDNHTISHMSAEIDDSNVTNWGLFGVTTDGAVIRNLKFSECRLSLVSTGTKEPLGFGFAVGSNNGGRIENVHLHECEIDLNTVAGALGVGGVAGANRNGETDTGCVMNCTTTGGQIATTSTVKSPAAYIVGGIVGLGTPGTRVEQCRNNGTTIKSRGAATGGIAGKNCTLIDCGNMADVEGATNTGGCMGTFDTAADNDEIRNCFNTGDITYRYGNAAYYHGGIIGTVNTAGSLLITRCFNTGTLEALVLDRPVIYGGIVARSTNASGSVEISDCYNAGTVIAPCNDSGKTSNSGGIVGDVAASPTVVRRCYNVGTVTSGEVETVKGTRAGLVGNRTSTLSIIEHCYYQTGVSDSGVAVGGTEAASDGVSDVPAGGKSASELKSQSGYDSSWDFTSVWEFAGGSYAYPQIKGMPHATK